MKKELETRVYSVSLETRDDSEETGIVKGRPIVYSSRTDIGWFDEIIEPGALDSTDLSDVRLCLNHDTSYVYARSRRNNPNSTMKLNPNEFGLDIEAALAINESSRAKDLFTAIKREDIDKMSFMFSVDEEDWEDLESDHPVRHIKKIGSVVEVSAVTFPAYDTTSINARSKEALENARSAVETARQQRSKSLESEKSNYVDLEKEKFKFKQIYN
jgi:HK97 family phage prohead protease